MVASLAQPGTAAQQGRNPGKEQALLGRTFREREAAIMIAKQDRSAENPKRDPDPSSNMQKDPDDWVSGDEPMTGAQASYLKTLSEEVGEPAAFDASLTKAAASKRIDALKAKTRR
jgi:hypothetical protein